MTQVASASLTWALILLSIVFGVLLVPVYGRVSPQRRIALVKKRIGAAILETVLFRRALAVTLRAQGRLVLLGVQYFLLAIPPVLILAVPMVFALGYINLYFGAAGLEPHQPTVLNVRTVDKAAVQKLTLAAGPQSTVVGPVRMPGKSEVAWRIELNGASSDTVTLSSADAKIEIPVVARASGGAIYTFLTRAWAERLLFPGGSRLPSSIAELSMQYPERSYWVGIGEYSWILVFFVISIGAGFAAAKFFGIEV